VGGSSADGGLQAGQADIRHQSPPPLCISLRSSLLLSNQRTTEPGQGCQKSVDCHFLIKVMYIPNVSKGRVKTHSKWCFSFSSQAKFRALGQSSLHLPSSSPSSIQFRLSLNYTASKKTLSSVHPVSTEKGLKSCWDRFLRRPLDKRTVTHKAIRLLGSVAGRTKAKELQAQTEREN
jgi:hypothetical protein